MNVTVNISGLSELAAWWGAVVATAVFVWDLYKWAKSGPRLVITTQTDMRMINVPNWDADKIYTTVRIFNRGDAPTTITSLGYFYYDSLFGWLRDRSKTKAVIGSAGLSHQLPHRLHPNDFWDGGIEQDEELEEQLRRGRMVLVVFHSGSKHPVKWRLKRDPPTTGVKEALPPGAWIDKATPR
jgi:hypothetical protein